jgi:hypothetical protein
MSMVKVIELSSESGGVSRSESTVDLLPARPGSKHDERGVLGRLTANGSQIPQRPTARWGAVQQAPSQLRAMPRHSRNWLYEKRARIPKKALYGSVKHRTLV